MRVIDGIRRGLLLTAAVTVVWLERRRRARVYMESPSVHISRNLALAGIAAATVRVLETPVVMPLARLVARRRWGLTHAMGGPAWLRGVIAILLLDYTLYVWHVYVHRASWLWRFHLVHHVDVDLDATTGLRFHAGELAASVPWRAAQVLAIGVTPGTLAFWQTLTLACVLFHHSNTRLSDRVECVLSWIVTTPRMHALHHSVDPSQMSSNFSSGLAIWDRLHGTARFNAEPERITVGVRGYLDVPMRLGRALALPLERASRTVPVSTAEMSSAGSAL